MFTIFQERGKLEKGGVVGRRRRVVTRVQWVEETWRRVRSSLYLPILLQVLSSNDVLTISRKTILYV